MNKTVMKFKNVTHHHVHLEAYTTEYIISATVLIVVLIIALAAVKIVTTMRKKWERVQGGGIENIELYS